MSVAWRVAVMLLFAGCPGKSDAGTDPDGTSTTGAAASSSGGDATTSDATTDVPTTGADGEGSTSTMTTGPGEGSCSCAGDSCYDQLCDGRLIALDNDASVDNAEYLPCAIEAMRDRTPGRVYLEYRYGTDPTQHDEVHLQILVDGTVLVHRATYFADVCSTAGPLTLSTFKEPAYFDGCLAISDPVDGFHCMLDGFLAEIVECSPKTEC